MNNNFSVIFNQKKFVISVAVVSYLFFTPMLFVFIDMINSNNFNFTSISGVILSVFMIIIPVFIPYENRVIADNEKISVYKKSLVKTFNTNVYYKDIKSISSQALQDTCCVFVNLKDKNILNGSKGIFSFRASEENIAKYEALKEFIKQQPN